ncbi:MAG: FAD-dependent oxidoreductase [Rhodopirellula sp.]|nr:FAD-dependent oxidoreductase [Rhodopirellula sp.]
MFVSRFACPIAAVILAAWLSAAAVYGQTLLIEAERFERLGGWVNDAQFMDQMGSPFLLAHGLGAPVEDATTTIELPAAGRIRNVVAEHTSTGRRVRLGGRWFADCIGDGCLGMLAGADHDMTLPGHMGRCNLWNVVDTGEPQPFPRCHWALDLSDKPFPGRDKAIAGVGPDRRGIEALVGWYWESGFDHDPFAKSEAIRDWNFRAMYGAWDALKNIDGRYETYRLNWAAYVSGKRESRRLLGDVVLTKEDVLQGKVYPDGCVPTGWPIDLHLPDPRDEKGFEGDAFIARASYDRYPPPYWIPYRCLYSRNVPNLFMAGRDISVTHEALGTVRVMRTGGCMGEVVGMAAAICKRHDADPRAVYHEHLEKLRGLLRQGVGKAPAPGSRQGSGAGCRPEAARLARRGRTEPRAHGRDQCLRQPRCRGISARSSGRRSRRPRRQRLALARWRRTAALDGIPLGQAAIGRRRENRLRLPHRRRGINRSVASFLLRVARWSAMAGDFSDKRRRQFRRRLALPFPGRCRGSSSFVGDGDPDRYLADLGN